MDEGSARKQTTTRLSSAGFIYGGRAAQQSRQLGWLNTAGRISGFDPD